MTDERATAARVEAWDADYSEMPWYVQDSWLDVVDELKAERARLDESRATNARLNLRCQKAESAARENVEACRRAGVSFGRGLANWAATDYRRKLDAIDRGTQLPTGWPDGPLDEVLGELVAAVFVQHADEHAEVAARSPAMATLSGVFNLRDIGAWLAPKMVELLFDAYADVVAARLVQLYGGRTRAVLEAVLAEVDQ